MANIFTQMPLILDTVWTANTIPAGLTAIPHPIEATSIEWFNPTSTSHTMVITDINGNVLIQGQCETANVSQFLWRTSQPRFKLKQGLWVLSTLGSGKVIIHY